jgi:hypothetical protein
MSSLLAMPKAFVDLLNANVIQTQMNTTTWLVLGALIFQGLSLLLTQRLALLLAFAAFFAAIVPTILTSTGLTPNADLKTVQQGKTTALFPNADGSKGKPSGRGFALLIIGIRINHPLGVLAPGAKIAGDHFVSMTKTLEQNKAELGYLGGLSFQADDYNSPSMIMYFESMEKLHEYAHGAQHREAWNWWNKNVKNMPHLGVYHEAYDIPAHSWEAVYLQTPKMGLGATEVANKDGRLVSVIEDARKGVWRTSAGRMGRGEKNLSETDPYTNE